MTMTTSGPPRQATRMPPPRKSNAARVLFTSYFALLGGGLLWVAFALGWL